MSVLKKSIVARPETESCFSGKSSIHAVLQRIYQSRNVKSGEELDYSLARLPNPDLLSGISDLATILVAGLQRQSRILVVADFDADGATSCALLIRGLRAFGARNVNYIVPNRFEYGYGLTPEIVNVAVQFSPDVIVTVDNGISSIEGVDEAVKQGIKVLITDHHLPGDILPDAHAIVNPNLRGDPFPSKSLAGVGVVFYCLLALRKRLRELRWFKQATVSEPNLARFLDLVALGTVADVVPLDHVNRILVSQGLRRIRKGGANAGIEAILSVSGRNARSLVSSDLGFAVGPRLNAAGRLDDMSMGIECLLTDDFEKAFSLAEKLDQLNQERKRIESRMKTEALVLLDNMVLEDVENKPAGICLFDPGWHQGVVGILASRIKERTGRPVIAFAADEGDSIKGSARSVPGVHIRDVLSDIAVTNPDLLCKFGGHAMAAGLTIDQCRLAEFSTLFASVVARYRGGTEAESILHTDGELEYGLLNVDFAHMLEQAGPWGQCFSEPVFEGYFDVLESRVMKGAHLKFLLCAGGNERMIDAVAFSVDDPEAWLDIERIRLVYTLKVNEFRNRQTAQLMIEYMERC